MVQTTTVSLLIRIYAWLLWMYPAGFRAEFGAEMTAVFADAIADAAGKSHYSVLAAIWRELRDWPGATLQAYLLAAYGGGVMLEKQDSSNAWLLIAGWTLVNAIGWAVGLAVGNALTQAASRLPVLNEDRFFAYALALSLSVTVGSAQWIVMRRYLPRSVRWVTGTLIGYLLCLVIFVGFNLLRLGSAGIWDDVLLLGLLGGAIGTPQWWILRQHYRQAGLWTLASAVGFQGLMWTVIAPAHSSGEFVTRGAIIGGLAAVVTGTALVWLVRQPANPTLQKMA